MTTPAETIFLQESVWTINYTALRPGANPGLAGLKKKTRSGIFTNAQELAEVTMQLPDHLEEIMTPAQVAEAQRLSREFRPRRGGVPSATVDSSVRAVPTKASLIRSGTGFFITEDGFLVTNSHVVEDGASLIAVTALGFLPARIVRRDPFNDLALLRVEGKHDCLPVTSSRLVKLGQPVSTVGFPNIGLQGFSSKLSKGEIASLAGAQDDARHFQISVPVQPGNSGGALVDSKGNVVGVVVGKLNEAVAFDAVGSLPQNVNYAQGAAFLRNSGLPIRRLAFCLEHSVFSSLRLRHE